MEGLQAGSNTADDTTEMTSSYHEITDTSTSAGQENDIASVSGRLLNKAKTWVQESFDAGAGSGSSSVVGPTNVNPSVQSVQQGHQQDVGLEEHEMHAKSRVENENIGTSDLNAVINEMEIDAKKLAQHVDTLTESLTGILHSLSSMTVDCVFTASDGVSQLCDTADASFKVMYQVMAKCEELNKAVQPLYQVHQQVKETRRLLDKVEADFA